MSSFEDIIKASYSAVLLVILNAVALIFDYSIKNWFGLPIVLFGAFSYFYNKKVMGKFWSIKVEGKRSVVKKGFFRYIRHPLYLGTVLACFGMILMTYNTYLLLTFLVLDLPYTFYRAKLEEKVLSKSLKGYKEYMKETWMFIPGLV